MEKKDIHTIIKFLCCFFLVHSRSKLGDYVWVSVALIAKHFQDLNSQIVDLSLMTAIELER